MLSARGDSIESMSYFDGFPVNEMILSSWFKVEFPGKNGFPVNIYAKMQPMLQTSAGFPYDCDPNRTSGALYHLVATYYVKICSSYASLDSIVLARPRSQIFNEQSLLIRRLEGFRSLWMILAWCRYCIPLTSWYTMYRLWRSLRIFCPIALCKSAYINSNTKYRSLSFSAFITRCSFTMFSLSIWCKRII